MSSISRPAPTSSRRTPSAEPTIAQSDYALEPFVYELNFEAAKLARQAADKWTTPDKPRFVAGAIGPTNKTLSISPDVNDPAFRAVTFDQMKDAFAEQVRALIDGGADVLLIETIIDTLSAKAALLAVAEIDPGGKVPVILSATITDRSGRTLSGQTIDAFWVAVMHAHPLAVGINCALGAREMRPYLAELSRAATTFVSSYPNAGLPNAFGQYDQHAPETGELVKDFATSGFVNIVGGCCGTTPDHIRAIAEQVAGVPPRKIPTADGRPSFKSPHTQFAGLEVFPVRPDSNFQMIGERTNVTGSKKFQRLIKDGKFGEAVDVALEQVRGGANLIDVNMDEGLLDSEQAMTHFLNLIATEPEISRLPIMIDSSKWSVLEAGLKCVQGKPVVNSISLKEGEDDFLKKARRVQQFGAGVVVMAFDETGQADTIAAQGRHLQARVYAADREARLRSDRHHLRSRTSSRSRRDSRSTTNTRSTSSRRAGRSRPHAPASTSAAASATCRSRSAATTSYAKPSIRRSCSTPSRPG